MGEFFNTLNNYSALINTALLVTIIGTLFNLTRISRTSLEDKHSAELAVLRAKIESLKTENNSLRNRIAGRDEEHKARIQLLQHQVAFFQRISDLPEDKRIEAIKFEYEVKISELETRLSELRADAEEKEELRKEIESLRRDSKDVIKIDFGIMETVIDVLPKLIRIIGYY